MPIADDYGMVDLCQFLPPEQHRWMMPDLQSVFSNREGGNGK
jgi:hypothetical protein